VRRKFLRKEETELGHVGDVVTKLALSQPQVRFTLAHGGRTLIEVYRHATLEERVAALLGRPLLEQMLPLSVSGAGGLKLHGLIAQPAASRASSGTIFTFINGRFIRDRVVQHAIMEGYRQLLERGRYPAAVLFLEIDPALVDVNVHPTKHEVRFREQGVVHDFIAAAVREQLRPGGWLATAPPQPVPPSAPLDIAPEAGETGDGDPVAERRLRVQEALFSYARRQPDAATAPPPPTTSSFLAPATPFVRPAAPSASEEPGFFASLQVLGQYRRSFILCQDGDDLVLIDQHAAHERIGFERLRAEYRHGRIERQRLLFPVTLDLDFREADVFAEHLSDLECLGFELEPFGGRTFVLKAVPRLLAEARTERLLRDVAAELAAVGRSALAAEAVEAVLAVMACHGVVRANQTLTTAEIAALLRDLDRVDFRAHCPHGRPVMKRLTLAEVERMFRRS
jgi:DNA mismatch repair protein MutL